MPRSVSLHSIRVRLSYSDFYARINVAACSHAKRDDPIRRESVVLKNRVPQGTVTVHYLLSIV